ncbi:MAG: hypothetical protein V4525_07700 [Pseudomonadota bacterium]
MTTENAISDPLALLDTAQSALITSVNASSRFQPANTSLVQAWSPELVRFLAISVLSFTFGALLLGTLLLWRSKAPASQVLRIFGVISIIGISALLLVAGYSNDQLTPIVGLFGAIAGYLLGKDSQSTAQHEHASQTKEAS